MKFIKSTIFASLALAAAALTACSDDNKYVSGNASNGAYFPDGLAESVEASNEVSVYEVPVYRVSADSPTSYEITSVVTITEKVNGVNQAVEVTEGFSIPSTVTFDGSSLSSSLPITYDLEKIEQDLAYNVALEIVNPTDYGTSIYEFTFTVSAPKERELWDGSFAATSKYAAITGKDVKNTGYYELTQCFTGTFSGMKVYKEYNPNLGPDKTFSIVFDNMFDWYDNSSGVDFKINVPDVDNRDDDGNIVVEIEPIACEYPGYDLYVADRYHYLVDVYGLDADGEVAQSWKDASTFNPYTGIFNLQVVYYSKSSGGAYGYGEETAQLDGYPKCSLSISYLGLTKDTSLNNYAMTSFTSGEDTNLVKAAIFTTGSFTTPYKASDAAALVEAASSQDIEAGSAIQGQFLVEDSGSYTVIGVTYDANGDAQDYDICEFYADLQSAEGWTSIGTATFTDGWFLSLLVTTPTRYPWDVEVRKNKTNDGWYQLVTPYNCDNFLSQWGDYNNFKNYHRNITFYVMDENYVEFQPQLSGVGYKSNMMGTEELGIANLEGVLYANYSTSGFTRKQIKTIVTQTGKSHSTCDADMIITIPEPYMILGFGDGQYYTIQSTSTYFGETSGLPANPWPCEIIMPESTVEARAAHKAKSVAKPTFRTLSSSIVDKQYTRVKLDKTKTLITLDGSHLATIRK